MELHELMKTYAKSQGVAPAHDQPTPELGKSLSLFHACLMESGLEYVEFPDGRKVVSSPMEISLPHLSRFVVGFLPFNSISTRAETNEVLFDLYSFFRWLDKRDIDHGLRSIKMEPVILKLTESQDRCLKLSHHLDEATGEILQDITHIVETINDIFLVTKIDRDFIHLQGQNHDDPIRVRLPLDIIELIRLKDSLDLVVGDTSDKWVILEAGQVYPELGANEGSAPSSPGC
ncbi:hypothetical protein [Nitrospina watsonii]|uniref:Uncharacterized protein n=1 Tax=Nitrospina watsonii TaxID=1323948 RepID=A0ABN8W3A8_9BACT|nr:hypothetical protein [Nitrospina watsonii]CAI2717826.1 conserved protein of unknown function [Nitrospina watsonii]